MKVFYDLHIHTCLSPCGDDESTPNNIVNMAKEICGLDVIAITDHNSVGNAGVCMNLGEKIGLTVIPGMELTTSEDIHVICLFSNISNAEAFGKYVNEKSMQVNNKSEIFGNQLYMNEKDEVINEEKRLLIVTSNIGIYDVNQLMKKFDGVAFPSHIFRESSGVIPILGTLPDELNFNCVEVTSPNITEEQLNKFDVLSKYKLLKNSDSHMYANINDNSGENYFYLEEISIKNVMNYIKRKK